MLRDTPNNETIIVEYGFVDSTGDDVDLLKNSWQDLAEAVVKAVTEYAGGIYVPKSDSNYYKVQSGDSLWSIAKKFNTTVDKLKEKNNLKSNLLSIGQILYLPETEDTNTKPNDDTVYIVKSGDTLYSIANKYNTTVSNLKTINNLTSNNLYIGQKLKLKPAGENDNVYIVQKGDSLWSIANKYNTTVNELKELNNLKSNNLSIGQKLLIPTSYTIYTVQKGDTLYSIARKFNTTVSNLESINNLKTSNLSIGQKLLISR